MYISVITQINNDHIHIRKYDHIYEVRLCYFVMPGLFRVLDSYIRLQVQIIDSNRPTLLSYENTPETKLYIFWNFFTIFFLVGRNHYFLMVQSF